MARNCHMTQSQATFSAGGRYHDTGFILCGSISFTSCNNLPYSGLKKNAKPVATSLLWKTFPMLLKDWGTALMQALCHWNTLKQLSCLHHHTEIRKYFNRTVTNRGTSAALWCSLGSSESHLLTERKPSHQHSSCPSSRCAAAALPFQRVSKQSLLTPRPSAMHYWHHFSQFRLFFLCSLLPPSSTILLVCLIVGSQCTRLAAPKQRTAASFSYLKAYLKLHFPFMCNGPFLMHMEFIQ